ncbi:cytochrome P450 [Gordonia shandongensis]|uniref:cytochrome P450 n=1 Tax=Gordonia shandongensis TaxID=376351 RepID=UPI00041A490E|nr:cytochrome P450 [Gordonia shandongensis]
MTNKIPVNEHPVTAPGVDITSRDFWAQPFEARDEAFRALRDEHPVSWHLPMDWPVEPDPTEAGFWALVTSRDIAYASTHEKIFSSDSVRWRGITMRPLFPGQQASADEAPSFMVMDPPLHNEYRRAISSAFTPKAVRRLDEKIRSRAAQIIDRVAGAGEFDFVAEVSRKLPMQTIGDLVGVPESLIDEFTEAADKFLNQGDPEVVPDGVSRQDFVREQLGILSAIGNDLVEFRRKTPADDIATALGRAQINGRPLTPDQITRMTLVLSGAGNDTTKQTTTRTVLALWANPAQREWLMEDFDARIGQSIEEFVRYATPVINFARTATQDVELGGMQIMRGDKVVMFYCSGNRDETVFDDPWSFDLSRTPPLNHVGFGGGGVHYCLGHLVAKAQLRALFSEILTTLKHMEITGEPVYFLNEFINGVHRLPVRA